MTATILIVDDEDNARENIASYLSARGFNVLTAATLGEARKIMSEGGADIITLDVYLPDGFGPILLDETQNDIARPPIILITAMGQVDIAVEAMNKGAFYFFEKPIDLGNLERTIQQAMEKVTMQREIKHYRTAQRKLADFITGESEAMEKVLNAALRSAQASASVLITGSTGTGKEVIARFIHQTGPRKDKLFIDISCPAIQSHLLESELFGYEAGAFTGAIKRKVGLMEVADGGILFLDEISSMPLDMQAKLLRALEERSIRRVGGIKPIKVDVQVLAASNRDLLTMIDDGTFRGDLYYRLKVVDINLPLLKHRVEDVPALIGHFIKLYNAKMGKNITNMTSRAMDLLKAYSWPGNIRELRNAVESAMIFCDDPVLDIAHLPENTKN